MNISGEEGIGLLLAGLLWPFLFQSLGKLGLRDKAAQFAAIGFCYVIAAIVHFWSSHTLTPDAVLLAGSPVATLALVIYRQVIKGDGDVVGVVRPPAP